MTTLAHRSASTAATARRSDSCTSAGTLGVGSDLRTKCQAPLRLISLIKDEAIAKKILVAMHLPAEAPRA